MHKFITGLSVAALAIAGIVTSCDKVEFPYGQNTGSALLDWSLYPDGDSAAYVQNGLWPSFANNTNTLRNVIIEDFTGHRCINCPASTENMEQLISTNPARIYGVGVHAGSNGITEFQAVNADFPTVFYCNEGLDIGIFFGSQPGSTFIGNPAFCVNRVKANDQFTSNAGSAIANKTNNCLASPLKVNIQAVTNYFSATRGLFLHTEIDKIDASLGNLGLVVYMIEDSLVARQVVHAADDPDGTPGDPDLSHKDNIHESYVHRDILRGCIDGKAFGRTLAATDLGQNGKYYVNYSYHLPEQYNADNMHLLIYVYDKSTYEIYQVIKKTLQD